MVERVEANRRSDGPAGRSLSATSRFAARSTPTPRGRPEPLAARSADRSNRTPTPPVPQAAEPGAEQLSRSGTRRNIWVGATVAGLVVIVGVVILIVRKTDGDDAASAALATPAQLQLFLTDLLPELPRQRLVRELDSGGVDYSSIEETVRAGMETCQALDPLAYKATGAVVQRSSAMSTFGSTRQRRPRLSRQPSTPTAMSTATWSTERRRTGWSGALPHFRVSGVSCLHSHPGSGGRGHHHCRRSSHRPGAAGSARTIPCR